MSQVWRAWTPMRGDIDVTADDTALDGETSGLRFTDFTNNHVITEIPPARCLVQVGFYAEALEDGTSSFGCEIWAGGPGTHGLAQKVCDVTGLAGGGWADLTNTDASTRLFYEDLTVADATLWGDVTTGNLLADGLGWVCFSSRGASWLYPRFYNVGDTTEAKRIKALVRIY